MLHLQHLWALIPTVIGAQHQRSPGRNVCDANRRPRGRIALTLQGRQDARRGLQLQMVRNSNNCQPHHLLAAVSQGGQRHHCSGDGARLDEAAHECPQRRSERQEQRRGVAGAAHDGERAPVRLRHGALEEQHAHRAAARDEEREARVGEGDQRLASCARRGRASSLGQLFAVTCDGGVERAAAHEPRVEAAHRRQLQCDEGHEGASRLSHAHKGDGGRARRGQRAVRLPWRPTRRLLCHRERAADEREEEDLGRHRKSASASLL